jgi:hypothetical protein
MDARVYVSVVFSNRLYESEERPGLADVFNLCTSLDRLERHRARFVVLRRDLRKIRALKCMRIEEEEEEEVYAPADER